MKKPRTAALILLAFSLAVLLVCCGSIALEARHECSGEHCPVCAHMHLCMDIVHGFGLGRVLSVLTLLFGVSLVTAACVTAVAEWVKPSPVALRVRQNN